MAFKVNYGLERAERNRVKQARKEAKVLARKNSGAGLVEDQETGTEEKEETSFCEQKEAKKL